MTRSGRLVIALTLNVGLVAAQVVAGFVAHSTSLLADAGHNVTDAAALVLSLGAVRWATRPRSDTRSYGNYRGTILAALANAAALAVVTCAVVAVGIIRLVHPAVVTGPLVAAVGGAALVANGIGAAVLTEHGHDLNVRSVLVHLLGDVAASALVVIAGIVIAVTRGGGWNRIDPAASLAVALLVLVEAVRILRESADVLLESTPSDIDLAALRREVTAVPGVAELHDLHVWSLSSEYRALSAHLVLTGHPSLEEAQRIGGEVRAHISDHFDIAHTTFEMECERCDDKAADACAIDDHHAGPRQHTGTRTRRDPE